MEEIIQEINERNKRKRNVIFFGVPEQDQQLSEDHRKISDKSEVQKIISSVSPNVNTANIKLFRLGQVNQGRIRPIKVILDDENDVFALIRQAKFLRNGNYKNVSMSFDRTRNQINYYNNVKVELNNMNASGNGSFKIKYMNGIPKVVPLNQ